MIDNRFIGLVKILGTQSDGYRSHHFMEVNKDYLNMILSVHYRYNIVQHIFVLDSMADWSGDFGLVYSDHLRDEL